MIYALYIFLSIIILSFMEWLLHRYVMHREHWISRISFRNHAHYHHREFFDTFNKEENEVGKQFNMKMDAMENFIFGTPIWIVAYLLSPAFCYTLFAVFIFQQMTWNLAHVEMHNPTSRWVRWFPYFTFIEEYHWLHHKYPGKNYNVVFPIFDYIMGTHINPTVKDTWQMRAEKIGRYR